MAEWIKVEHTTPTKPEILAMALDLERSPAEILGAMVRVWLWADQHLTDGCARGVTETQLDDVAGVPGVVGAMKKVRWIRVTKWGLKFPHYDYHLSESAKKRALSARRMQRSRCALSVTKAQPEKNREDKSITPPKPPPGGGRRLRRVEKPEDLV